MAPDPTEARSSSNELIERLAESLRVWDDAYADIVVESQKWPMKATEERLKVAVRNELRQRKVEIPEIVRWRLRALIGFRSEED